MATDKSIQQALAQPYSLPYFSQHVLRPVFGERLVIYATSVPMPLNPSEERVANAISKYGEIKLADHRQVELYEVALAESVDVERNKVSIGAVVKKLIYGNNAVLVNFYHPGKADHSWRFSFIAKDQILEQQEVRRVETNPKRYTYILGPNESCKTAGERFHKLSTQSEFTVGSFEDAFSVEKLSKTFFDDYKNHYLEFVKHLSKRETKASVFNGDEKAIRDFAKKLLGRIVFLYFVQKKGWLGASSEQWQDGDHNFIQNLFIASGKKESFYSLWLRKLFYDSLNNPGRAHGDFELPGGNVVKVPFLNGGLFEDDDPKGILVFPARLFEELFDFFNQFNFTIYEDSPDDHTVAVDPEMLGHIFENLLEDNKDKGAYYTPKEIVHYMCQESLIEYLSTKLSIADITTFQQLGKNQMQMFGNDGKKRQLVLTQELRGKNTGITRVDVEEFIKHKQVTDEIRKNTREINTHLDKIKICDPAIGSGAFPMGLLHEIFNAKQVLNGETGMDAAAVKQNIIQNSIYGVDIEQGAVDIARLRFWLSLIVDEDKPRPLPNLDYKIVAGDSLVPKFEGEVIDIEWDLRNAVDEAKPYVQKISDGLDEIVADQKNFFDEDNPERKKTFAEKIRTHKIDLLINQLTFDKFKYKTEATETGKLDFYKKSKNEIKKEAEIKLKIVGFEQIIRKLQVLKNKANNPLRFFDWKLEFAEIMNPAVATGGVGFDIIIGNPPYINISNLKPDDYREKLKSLFYCSKNKTDLYAFFLEASTHKLKLDGNLIFIIPHTWKATDSFSKFREILFTQNKVKTIVNLEMGVFQAIVKPLIIHLIRKTDKDYSIQILNSHFRNESSVDINEILTDSNLVVDTTSNRNQKSVYKTIEHNSTRLINVLQFSRGIKTSDDARFVKQQKLNTDCKKVFRGKNIKAYQLNWQKEFVWYRPDLMKEKVGSVSYSREFFEVPEKIVTQRVNSTLQLLVAYDSEKNYFLDTVNVSRYESWDKVTSHKYLCGVLNSKLINFWYCNKYKMPTIGIYELHSIPIKRISKSQQSWFDKLVEEIIERKEKGKSASAAENKIDLMVYKLYQLSYGEVLVVDREFEKQMSRGEYEKVDYGFEYVDQSESQASGDILSLGI